METGPIDNSTNNDSTNGNTSSFPLSGKGTHFWDCNGGACDSTTLQPWDQNKYRYAPEYAPMDPNDYGGPSAEGENLWMTGAANDYLSSYLNGDDGCCGADSDGGGGCGKCMLVSTSEAVNSDWKVLVMKKNRCPPWSNGCGDGQIHLDFAAPGFDNLQFSTANICGQSSTYISQAQSSICGSWYDNGASTQDCDCSSLPESTDAEIRLKKGC